MLIFILIIILVFFFCIWRNRNVIVLTNEDAGRVSFDNPVYDSNEACENPDFEESTYADVPANGLVFTTETVYDEHYDNGYLDVTPPSPSLLPKSGSDESYNLVHNTETDL